MKEFSFKFTHRIIITKKELFRFKIKPDGNCVYCGEPDSIDHTFLACRYIQSFVEKVLKWFNLDNGSIFSLNSQEIVFGLLNERGSSVAKLNYTLFFLGYYIYQKNLQEDSLVVQHFISQIKYKYSLEELYAILSFYFLSTFTSLFAFSPFPPVHGLTLQINKSNSIVLSVVSVTVMKYCY